MEQGLREQLAKYRQSLSEKLSEIRRISDDEYNGMRDSLAGMENQRTEIRKELKRRLAELHEQIEKLKHDMKGYRSSQRAQSGDEAARLAREIHYLTVLIGERNTEEEAEGEEGGH